MVKAKFQEYFPTKPNCWTYSCLHCRAHLARHQDLISKSFQGSQGRAYLFSRVVNVDYSEAKQRVLLTGIHFVSDVFCACCSVMLGWRYERAFEASQRYKEGKVIVELAHLIKDNCWDSEWLVPARPSTLSFPLPMRRQTKESTTPVALPLPPSPPPRMSRSLTTYSSTHGAISWEACDPATRKFPLESNSNVENLSVSVCVSPFSSSPPHTCSHYGFPGHSTISPGPSSSNSSCCDHTPEKIFWVSGLRLMRPDCLAPVAGTAAHGAQSRSSTPPVRGSRTRRPRSVSSDLKSLTLPISGVKVTDENRGRSTKRRPIMGLRVPFGCSTNTPGGPGSKPRVRLRTTFTRRASSSSPSRAFLLPLISDDESDQSVSDQVQSTAACAVQHPTSQIALLDPEKSRSVAMGDVPE
ncbi:Protein yippee [Fasciola hepatica]|uniref:Protein yippee n=1 Tax=Fasciola hepatica TaxID=6192 RepID=A0A2H1CNE7_FASHE|nr:Protein yippee [Fasciola hepatica]